MPSVKDEPGAPALELFETQFLAPAENLACDEALLDLCDESDHPGFLRFWESPNHFVVLGYGKHLEHETFRSACEELKVPILRRCSGGGTVLQGPGCWNYSLVLPIESTSELATISGANCFIMRRNRNAIARVSSGEIEVKGYTDLVIDGRKFSGNAQRRKRRCLLFHGAVLIDFDLELITRTLRPPAQQPEYRAGRSHTDFLTNIALDRAQLQAAFLAEWNATSAADRRAADHIREITARLVTDKYARKDWNERF